MGLFEEHYLANKNSIDARVFEKLTEKSFQPQQKTGSGYVPVGGFNKYTDPARQPRLSYHHAAQEQRWKDDVKAAEKLYGNQMAAFQTYQDRMSMNVEQGQKELGLRTQRIKELQTMRDMLDAQDWEKRNPAIQRHIALLEQELEALKPETAEFETRLGEAKVLQSNQKAEQQRQDDLARMETYDTRKAGAELDARKKRRDELAAQRDQLLALNPHGDKSGMSQHTDDLNKQISALDAEIKDLEGYLYRAAGITLDQRYAQAKEDQWYAAARTAQSDVEKVLAVLNYQKYGSGDPAKVDEYTPYLTEKYGQQAQDLAVLYEQLKKQRDIAAGHFEEGGGNYEQMAQYETDQKENEEFAAQQEWIREQSKEHPVWMSATSVGENFAAPGDFIYSAIKNKGHDDPSDPDTYRPASVSDYESTAYVNTVRDTVANEVLDGGVAGFLYQTGMSMADSLAALGVSGAMGIPRAATVLMGMSAAAHTAKDVVERGGTGKQAFWSGLLAGATEALMEKVPLDNLLAVKNVEGVKGLLKGVLKQAGTEGAEEMLTELANMLYDGLIMGDKSNFNLTVQQLMANDPTLTMEEAQKQAMIEQAKQIGLAGLGGALSGGIMGGVANVGSYLANRQSGITMADEVIQAAMDEKNTTSDEMESDTNIKIDVDAEIGQYGIKSYNDYVGVQNAVYNTLKEEGFLDPETERKNVENDETGLIVEIGWRGIKETFGSGKRYQSLPAALKRLKVATIKHLPEIIKYGKVIEREAREYHNGNPDLKYTYIQCPIVVDGEARYVVVDIRQSKQKNIFWMHGVYLNEKSAKTLDSSTGNPGQAINKGLTDSDTVSQPAQTVNENNLPNSDGGEQDPVASVAYLLDNESERFEDMDEIGYAAYYEAGLSGAPIENVNNVRSEGMTQEQKQEAYDAGRRDAADSLAREVADAPRTPSFGKNARLIPNDYSRRLSKQEAGVLNALAYMTGMQIELTEDLEDGRIGTYNPNTGTMKINAKMKGAELVVAAHEITHRMQQAAPEQYRQYREYVVNAISQKVGRAAIEYTIEKYAAQGINLTGEQAMDELASDFAMEMFRDGKLFQDLMRENRSAAQKLLDAIKNFLTRVKAHFGYSPTVQNSAAMETYGVDLETLQTAAQMWEQALSDTQQRIEGKEIAAQTDGGEERYMISESFQTDVQNWLDTTSEADRMVSPGYFKIGTTSDPLVKIGVKNSGVYWRKYKIGYILQEHPEIDGETIKRIPEILEQPAVILKSATRDDSIVLLGDVLAKNGNHIMVALELTPRPSGKMEADFSLVTSAYSRSKGNLQNLLKNSEFLYIDENQSRANTWLKLLGVQFPSYQPTYGSVGRVTYHDGIVNIEGKTLTELGGIISSPEKNSVAATKSFRADHAKELMDKYGTIRPGENPHRKANVPKWTATDQKVSETIRTVIEAEATPDAAVLTLEELAADGVFSYERYTDQQAMDDARSTIQGQGYAVAMANWIKDVERGKVSKENTALGWELYNQAANAGDMENAITVLNYMVEHQRNAAQALQATRILKQMTPDAQLYGVQKSVSRLRQELKEKFGAKAPNLKIDKALAEQFLRAETEADQKAALKKLYENIGSQMPATLKEQWDSWRYLSMLGNVRTHIRNMAGNVASMPMRGAGNQLSALGQALFLPKEQRTRSLGMNVSGKRRALVQAAKADFEGGMAEVVMQGEKYDLASDAISKGRTIFKNKLLEGARKKNGDLLEAEDRLFSKQAYVSALAGYLNAKGYTAEDFTGGKMTQQQKDDARAFAVREAQRATYRDANAFSDLVSSVGFKNPGENVFKQGANALIEGVLPFKKTPANVLARAFEYSPAGLLKAVTADAVQAGKGNITADQFIDSLTRGLTGSAVFALGYLLTQWGVLKATPEDEEQSELEGRQNYSLELWGKSYTLDWLAPAVMPLFMGVELYEIFNEESGGDAPALSEFADVLQGLTGPLQNMSMLDGLNSTIESASIAAQNGGSAVGSVVGTAALNYFMQAFPTAAGQLERAFSKRDKQRQTTFIDKDDPNVDTGMQYTLARAGNKIPLFDYHQVPYVDGWGRTQDNGNVAKRFFDNALNPAYTSDVKETDVDREIKRLESITGENYTPARVKNNELTVNGKTVFLTEDEFVTYATAKGQNDFTIRESLMNSELYEALDDETKGKLHDAAEDYAKVLAMQETGLKPELSDWQEDLQDADIKTVVETLVVNAITNQAENIGKEQGGSMYDGLAYLLDDGQINDTTAYLAMSDSMQDAYGAYADGGKVFTAEELIDVYAYAKRNGGDSSEKELKAAEEYITSTFPHSGRNDEKALALLNAMETVLTHFIPMDSEASASTRAQYGAAGQKAIIGKMTENQQANYYEYVAASGVSPYVFEQALKIKGMDNFKKADVSAALDLLGLTAAQKQAVLNGLYK